MTLFAAAPAHACPAYTNLRNATDGPGLAARLHCDDLWATYQPHADAAFTSEFPLHLHDRWFEMYLTVALLRAGHNVSCPKQKEGGPDILVTMATGARIWIEATCASPGEPGHPDSVPKPHYADIGAGEKPVATRTPTEQMVLRIRSALAAKEIAYRNYLQAGIVAATDVLVIAVNVHAVHWAFADMDDLMLRALYGRGDLVLTLNRETRTVVDRHHNQLTHITKKKSGALVGVQPFIDESVPHISALIGSRADAGNLPGRMGDDLIVFPNLTTRVGWPTATIRLGEEWEFRQGEDGWDGNRHVHVAA